MGHTNRYRPDGSRIPHRNAKQMQNNAKAMAAARALAERRRVDHHLTQTTFFRQEGLAPTTGKRLLRLASLPAQIQTLVENGTYSLQSAEEIARGRDLLSPHEQIVVAEKIGRQSREYVKAAVTSMRLWSQASRAEFIADATMSYEQAHQRYAAEEAAQREAAQRDLRHRQTVNGRRRTFEWIKDDVINAYNQTMDMVRDDPRRVDPMTLNYVVPQMLEALEVTTEALMSLGRTAEAREALRELLTELTPDRQLPAPDPGVVWTVVEE